MHPKFRLADSAPSLFCELTPTPLWPSLLLQEPTPLQQGTDVSVQACWGVNSQTYKNIFNALALSDCFANGSKDSEAARHRFIEDRLLPAVQLAGPRGCSLLHVVNSMQRDARSHGDAAEAEICGKLAAQISAHEVRSTSALMSSLDVWMLKLCLT